VSNAAIFDNNAGGTVSGLLTNSAGTTTNNGQLNGGAAVSGGTLTNNNLISGTVGITATGIAVNNLTITGAVNNASIFTNNANGTVSGLLTNSAGITTNDGQLNGGAAVSGGTLTNNNLISGTVGITATGIVVNNLTITGTVNNAALFNNNAGGTVSGLLTNTAGTATNAGQLNGGALVSGGILTNNAGGTVTGTTTITGGVVTNNGGTFGAITNTSGTFGNTSGSAGAVSNAGSGSNGGTIASLTNTGVFNNTGIVTGASSVSGGVAGNSGTFQSTLAVSAGSFVNQTAGVVTGATTNTGGVVINNGGTFGAFTNTSGTLTGTGSVQTLAVNGGTFAPGNGTPGSSMNVTTSLSFQSASIFMVQVNPTTSSLVNVTGNATLGGATVNANFAAGSYVSKQYAILQATGTVSGMFNPTTVNTSLPSGFHTTLSYDTHDAFLNLALNLATPAGLNANQQNVGNALTNFFNSTGSIPMVFGALTPSGLSQASGETATGSQQSTFNAMTQFMGVMTDPFVVGRGDSFGASGGAASGYASTQKTDAARDAYAMFTKAPPPVIPFEQRWSVWAAGFGGSQNTDGNTALGSNNTTSSIAGSAVGADYRFSPFTIAGFALAGGGTNFSVANGGSGRSDLFQAGAFIRHDAGAAYLSGALAYGWQDITTNRTVTIAGTDMLRAEFNANAFSGRVETGYRFVAPWIGGVGITPYAAGQFTTFDLPSYAESAIAGASTFALAYGARSVTDPRSELGFRTDKSWAMADGILTLRGRVAWAHDYDTDRAIGATFQSLPGASFVVNGAAQAADSALVTASVEKKWLNGWSAAATFEGEFSNVTASYAGKGVVRYAW
jgi:uncharacterized protein with beta-barrel porin domain